VAVTTHSHGIATSPTLQANTNVETYNGKASVDTGAPPVFFTPTNLPDVLSTLTISGGGTQATAVNTAFAQPLQVIAQDQFGNPIAGVPLTFTAPGTEPSATSSLLPIVTDAAGTASVPVTANGQVGSYLASLASGALQVSFNLTNLPLPGGYSSS